MAHFDMNYSPTVQPPHSWKAFRTCLTETEENHDVSHSPYCRNDALVLPTPSVDHSNLASKNARAFS